MFTRLSVAFQIERCVGCSGLRLRAFNCSRPSRDPCMLVLQSSPLGPFSFPLLLPYLFGTHLRPYPRYLYTLPTRFHNRVGIINIICLIVLICKFDKGRKTIGSSRPRLAVFRRRQNPAYEKKKRSYSKTSCSLQIYIPAKFLPRLYDQIFYPLFIASSTHTLNLYLTENET